MITPKHHVFICAGGKLAGDKKGMCNTRGATGLIGRFIEEIEERELSGEVLVSASSCFGICDKGPVAVVYPEGVWYGGLDGDAVAKIAEEHLENGAAVQEYVI